MTRPETGSLEELFEAARANPPAVPRTLLDRIEAQSAALQPPPPRAAGWLTGIGGFAGLGGLVTATVAGVWIGMAGPAPLSDPVALFLGAATLEETETLGEAGFGWEIEEG